MIEGEDERLVLKQYRTDKGKTYVSTLKLIKYDEFLQLYVNNTSRSMNHSQMRLYPEHLQKLKEFLGKIEKSS